MTIKHGRKMFVWEIIIWHKFQFNFYKFESVLPFLALAVVLENFGIYILN